MKIITLYKLYFLVLFFSVFSCNAQKKYVKKEFNHIGDTKFTVKKDNPNFKFCDTTKIYHSRASISYKNGHKGLQNELIKQYKYKPSFKNFTGYFFIRLAVNCKNESGRFRWEIVDEEHQKTTCSKTLENYIVKLIKNLKGWKSVKHNNKSYDGYTFFIIKFKNGKIIGL